MKTNLVKQALADGKVTIGTQVAHFPTPDLMPLLAAAGLHWVFLDAEHGGLDLQRIRDLCWAAVPTPLCPVVRVADLQYALIARALDCGAQGIILPRVESPDLLTQAVRWTKFPPMGIRGFGISPHHLLYNAGTMPEIIEHLNAHTMVVLQIETQLAFERRDELLSVPGIDAVLVGPADLSVSLGVPGQFQHPEVVRTIEAIRDSCVAHGVAPGIHVRTLELATFWRERGMRFLSCSNETGLLLERARQVTQALQ